VDGVQDLRGADGIGPRDAPAPIPVASLRELAPWALFALALLSLAYFAALAPGDTLHEALHDGRHLLAFPCH
jgi:cobalt transporter subunit CbtB